MLEVIDMAEIMKRNKKIIKKSKKWKKNLEFCKKKKVCIM